MLTKRLKEKRSKWTLSKKRSPKWADRVADENGRQFMSWITQKDYWVTKGKYSS